MSAIADFIERHHTDIVRLWTSRVQRSPAARALSPRELLDVLPIYFSSLVRLLRGREEAHVDRLIEQHLSNRLRQGFGVDELVNELSLVGPCVLEVWSKVDPSTQPDQGEVEGLYDHLNRASAIAVSVVTQHLLQDEQIEKRYQRLLQKIAFEALGPSPDTVPLRMRLKDSLILVKEAMDADWAAILLYDREKHGLTLSACSFCLDGLEPYFVGLDSQALACAVASSEYPVYTGDVATTDPGLNATIREAGIHSLLGARLWSRGELFGVLLVGTKTISPFDRRRTWRIETLAGQLAMLLDHARLWERLRTQNERLRIEQDLREGFVSLLAHDLRGPLSAARLGAEALIRAGAGMDIRAIAAKIVHNIARTDRMVRDMLDFHTVRVGRRMPLSLAEVDLTTLIHDVVEELVGLHGDRFLVRLPPQSIKGVWGAEALRRAIWNLASNAIQYGSREAPVSITVTPDRDGVRIAVHNEGEAIPPETQATLFDPFVRAQAGRQQNSRGWGLGLTLVRGCAESHGGNISVESLPDEGTTFTIRIPRDASQNRAHPAAGPPLHP